MELKDWNHVLQLIKELSIHDQKQVLNFLKNLKGSECTSERPLAVDQRAR